MVMADIGKFVLVPGHANRVWELTALILRFKSDLP